MQVVLYAVLVERCSRCHDQPRRPGGRWCRACHAENMRETRRKHVELSDEQRAKANCRSHTNVLIRRGVLVPVPCERCGSVDVQAHHLDYTDPRRVAWLCERHRRELRRREDNDALERAIPQTSGLSRKMLIK